MKRTASTLSALILLFALPVIAQDVLKEKYFSTATLLANKDYEGTIKIDQEILASPDVPKWLQIACNSDIASAYAQLGNLDAAVDAFGKAVALGYNDYIGVQTGGLMNPLFSDPRFRKLYSSMQISSVEKVELEWMQKEIQAEIHDMNMIITENMNRKDSTFTEVPMPSIPSHPSTVSIEGAREVLHYVQNFVRTQVMESDSMRIKHVTSMGIINNMPGGTGNNTNMQQMEILNSQAMAKRMAESRRTAAAAREFQLPAGLSRIAEPVPPLPE